MLFQTLWHNVSLFSKHQKQKQKNDLQPDLHPSYSMYHVATSFVACHISEHFLAIATLSTIELQKKTTLQTRK